MKKSISIVCIGLVLMAFASSPQFNEYRIIDNNSFSNGETLEFRVHVGLVNAGTSKMHISDTVFQINQRPCYKIEIEGKTTGFFDLFLRVRDEWGTYLDTSAIVPQRFYRNIQEGKYRKYEIVEFDHQNDTATVVKLDKETKKFKESADFKINKHSQDLVSGYYFLRTLDYDQYQKQDTITLSAFFDDENYDFSVRYLGREQVKTKLGRIDAIVLSPLMPENSIFDGEDAIRVWLSDDQNKIPIKVKAKMWVGAVEIDILEAKNLKSPLAIAN